MPPPTMQQRYAGVNNPPGHHQYPTYTQPGLPPPSLASAGNYMSGPTMNANPFAIGNNSLNIGGNFGRPGPGMPGDTGLGSQHVMNSFAAAGMHQQQNGMVDSGSRGAANKHRIRDVWASNLHEEMGLLEILSEFYPYIATHTIFPGIVARPMGNFNGKSDYHYQCMRCNVDLLKILQLGITLFNEDGDTIPTTITSPDMPAGLSQKLASRLPKQYHNNAALPTTWQFHFQFSRDEDMYSELSLKSHAQAGIAIERLATDGIDPDTFASMLITSGLVCDEDVHWLTNHAVYDLGYLLKCLSHEELPDDDSQFLSLMSKYFPSIYDIKFVIKEGVRKHHAREITPLDPSTHELLQKLEQKTQLESLVDTFNIKRYAGPIRESNTAGVACMYTGKVFFKLRKHIFNDETPHEVEGLMWGIGQYSQGLSPEKHTPPQHHIYNENERPGMNGYTNGAPSTPNTGNAGLVHTPQHSNGGMGPMTPSGAPFSMGAFTYGNK